MNDKEQRQAEMSIRATDFFAPQINDFSHNTVAAAKITGLSERITNINLNREAQIAGTGAAKQKTSLSDTHYDELKDAMRDIVGFAGSIARDHEGLENKFRMPRSTGKRNLIAAARVFATDAATFEELFISYGMPSGFIENLRTKAESLEQSMSEASSAKELKVGARSELNVQVKEAVDLVRQLDPIVRMVYRNDATNLAAWTFASHVQRDDKPKPKPPTPA